MKRQGDRIRQHFQPKVAVSPYYSTKIPFSQFPNTEFGTSYTSTSTYGIISANSPFTSHPLDQDTTRTPTSYGLTEAPDNYTVSDSTPLNTNALNRTNKNPPNLSPNAPPTEAGITTKFPQDDNIDAEEIEAFLVGLATPERVNPEDPTYALAYKRVAQKV